MRGNRAYVGAIGTYVLIGARREIHGGGSSAKLVRADRYLAGMTPLRAKRFLWAEDLRGIGRRSKDNNRSRSRKRKDWKEIFYLGVQRRIIRRNEAT